MKMTKKINNGLTGLLLFVFLVTLFYICVSVGCNQIVFVVPDETLNLSEVEQLVLQYAFTSIYGFIVGYCFTDSIDISCVAENKKKDYFKLYKFLLACIVPIFIYETLRVTIFSHQVNISALLVSIALLIVFMIISAIGMIIGFKIIEKIDKKDVKDINEKLKELK